MGNRIGTVYWDSSEKDQEIKTALDDLMKKYMLSAADSHYLYSEINGISRYGVSIDGLWNLIYTDLPVKAFLYDAERFIRKYNLNVDTNYEYLSI